MNGHHLFSLVSFLFCITLTHSSLSSVYTDFSHRPPTPLDNYDMTNILGRAERQALDDVFVDDTMYNDFERMRRLYEIDKIAAVLDYVEQSVQISRHQNNCTLKFNLNNNNQQTFRFQDASDDVKKLMSTFQYQVSQSNFNDQAK